MTFTKNDFGTDTMREALRPPLAALEPQMLTVIRNAVADVEEAAWRRVAARRIRAVAPGPYAVAVFTAAEVWPHEYDSYSAKGVELYTEALAVALGDPSEHVDLDDAELTCALEGLSALRHPTEGSTMAISLDGEDVGR
ncbi:hypothetical protein [Streptomyces sp. NPDC058657]|uniref:hypothetical protein n=1 Tax=unclassified Streptomyces TaxID=2593676 RepID=UPI0036514BD3